VSATPAYTLELSDWTFGSPQDISDVASEAKGLYRMIRPSVWELTVPTSGADGVTGISAMDTTLQVTRDAQLIFNGICRKLSAKGDKNRASAVLQFIDPMIMWWFRRVRDATGRLATPFFANPITVGEFLFDSITNSETFEGTPPGTDSSMLLALGSDSTTANVNSALGNFPLTIGEMAAQLGGSAMGEWKITPSSGTAGIFGTLDVADRLGTNLSGSVELIYRDQDPTNNVEAATYDEDAAGYCNALNYWITKLDRDHWAARFTRGGSSPPWPDPPQSDIETAIDASRAAHQVWLADRFFEDEDVVDPTDDSPTSPERMMYRRMWQLEASLRVRPKRIASAVPTPDGPKPWDDFDMGDWLSIDLDGLGIAGVEGVQRVYGWDVSAGNDAVERLTTLYTSADGGEVVAP
jgi:hypothetical protein